MNTNQALTVFNFQDHNIRAILQNGKPWFVASDLCDFLELGNVSQAVSRIKEKHRNTIISNDGISGNPNKLYIDEPGMYKLIFTSRKEEAETFQDWVYEEVLPSIRKTGKYSVSPLSLTDSLLELLGTFQEEGKDPVTARQIQQRRRAFRNMPAYEVRALLTSLAQEGKLACEHSARTQRYGLPEAKRLQ